MTMSTSNNEQEEGNPFFQSLTFGQIIVRTFKIFFGRFDIFSSFSALAFIPLAVCFVLIFTVEVQSFAGDDDGAGHDDELDNDQYFDDGDAAHDADDNYDNDDEFFPPDSPIALLLMLLYLLIVIAQAIATTIGSAATVHAAAEIYAGKDPKWRDSLRVGAKHTCAILCANAMVFAILAAGVFVITTMSEFMMDSILIAVLTAIFMVAFLGLYFMVTVSTVCLLPIIAIEGAGGPIAALKRSFELAEGRRWRFFCSIFTMWVIEQQVFMILFTAYVTMTYSDALPLDGLFFLSEDITIFWYLPLIVFLPLSNVLKFTLYGTACVEEEGLTKAQLIRMLEDDVVDTVANVAATSDGTGATAGDFIEAKNTTTAAITKGSNASILILDVDSTSSTDNMTEPLLSNHDQEAGSI